jgi:hypothetical protein
MVSNKVPRLPTMSDEPQKLHDNCAIWSEMKNLCQRFDCTSLGEGAPDSNPPKFLVDQMMKAIEDGHN